MSIRSRKTLWPVVLLLAALAFFTRGRTEAPKKPVEPHRGPPAAQKSDRKTQLRLRVVGVHDGDSLTGLDENKVQFKIRLDAIDAPELGQPFGQAAKKALSEKVFGKDVVVIPKTTDRYGRTVGHVIVDGRDVNLAMLEEGVAWHYKKYDKNKRLAEAERQAREAKRGLWQDRGPVPPWEWRKREKEKRTGE